MSSMTSGHLTDEQFAACVAECAIVSPSPESDAHLRECSQCREELTQFADSMENFSTAAFRWSETQSAVSLRAVARHASARSWLAPAAWALAATVLLAAGVPMAMHHGRQPAAPSDAAVADVPDDSDAQIAEDNRLMRSVNMAIGVNDSSPLQEYKLQTGRHARLKTASGLRSE
jgi:predicted anti-sigma-YlaC factor YlaD